MRIVIAGAHGKIALILGRMLHDRGEDVVGIIRNPAQSDDLRAVGVTPSVLDLEHAAVDAVARVFTAPSYLATIRPDEETFLALPRCELVLSEEHVVHG